jgi:putative ABC transport system permease protein
VLQKLTYNVGIALESLVQNRLRALLTSLGIIFGVASVIAMLAIGRGAEQRILEQIQLLGATNVIVEPVIEQKEGPVDDASSDARAAETRPFSPGLTLLDAESIAAIVPGVEAVSPEVVMETNAVRAGLRRSTKLVGVTPAFFTGGEVALAEGRFFSDAQMQRAAPVAVIGQDVKTKFFAQEEALGKRIKLGRLWLTVVGVLERRALDVKSIDRLGIRNYNLDVYTPLPTMLARFADRARVTARDVQRAESNDDDDDNGSDAPPPNYHQLDRLVVRTAGSAYVPPVADVVSRMLRRRHNDVVDVQVIVPEQLLKQERETQTIFNIVLASIASISLIVGGIGIMNIMLASVLERIREIGVRRAVGATRRDIAMQFLIEATTISVAGGLLGIALGMGLSAAIEAATSIPTIVSGLAVGVAFVVSAGVGLVFGFLPARRAAERDPVESLRYGA